MHATDHTPSPQAIDFELPDEASTLALGAALALKTGAGLVVYLEGDLGAGKTTLVRGWLRALGETGPVKSPTYALVEVHVVSELNLYHFDFYRFNQPEDYLDAGLDEYFGGDGLCLVEWPDKAAPYLPAPDIRIELTVRGNGRHACLRADSERGGACLSGLRLPTNSASPAATSCVLPRPA
jgi:tRNA threonylcarbamoyladenosine biosynthesis protein TsaE